MHYVVAWKPLQETLDRLPGLRVLFSLGAGVDHIFALKRLPDVPVVRIVDPDLTARMTEYVVWQALHHMRRGGAYRRQQADHVWQALDQPRAGEFTDRPHGLRRHGGGLRRGSAASSASSFAPGRARRKSPPGVEMFSGASALDAFLAGTDILVSLLPLTAETRGLIDLGLLRKLRRANPLGGAVFINAGRGGSHREADIAEALREGTLAGASLDVFETEPLAEDSPLWDFENVLVTPHVAAVSDAAGLAAGIAGQILAFERGEPLRNRVDPARGY